MFACSFIYGQIEGKLGQMGGGTDEQSKTRHGTNNPKSLAKGGGEGRERVCRETVDKDVILHLSLTGFAHTRSRSSLFALFITCRRETAQLPGNPTHLRYKRDKPAGEEKKEGRKRKKWIFFDESRYKPREFFSESPSPFFRLLLLPLRSSRGRGRSVLGTCRRTFQIMSHQRKRAAATAQLCAIYCLFCMRNRCKRNFKKRLYVVR